MSKLHLWGVLFVCGAACVDTSLSGTQQDVRSSLPNNYPHDNPTGKDASYSTQGSISLDNAFFQPQGTNGRHCATCHAPQDGWSITPATAQQLFDATGGLDPLFSRLDADKPTFTNADIAAMSVEQRRAIFSMLLEGKFTRSVNVPATRDYDIIDVHDPMGVGTTSRFWFFRRPLATANFKSPSVMWDLANTVGTDLYAGLVRQARGNVTGAQEGAPASDATITEIVDYEFEMSNAQLIVPDVGRLDSDGATGGPEAHASQPLVVGRFDLFDAWATSENALRVQIYRGQELFNRGDRNGRQCAGCHNAANSGQNVQGTAFNIGASNPVFAKPNMAAYTVQSRLTGAIVATTDPGRGGRTGRFADLNRFKVPSLRGMAGRAPFFHGGIADTLADVVAFYEASLGFDFTDDEAADLVAFLNAL
jgi:cytochrome c peroxidase